MWLLFSLPFPSLHQLCRHNHRRIAFLGGGKKEERQPPFPWGELKGSQCLPAPSQQKPDTSFVPQTLQFIQFRPCCEPPCCPETSQACDAGWRRERSQTEIRFSPRLGPASEFEDSSNLKSEIALLSSPRVAGFQGPCSQGLKRGFTLETSTVASLSRIRPQRDQHLVNHSENHKSRALRISPRPRGKWA